MAAVRSGLGGSRRGDKAAVIDMSLGLRGWAMGTAGFTGGCPAVKYWPCTRDGRILVFPTAHKTEPEEAVFHIQLGFEVSGTTLSHTKV